MTNTRSSPDIVAIPREPTREMWVAMADAVVSTGWVHHDRIVAALYHAILESAPVNDVAAEARCSAATGEPVAWQAEWDEGGEHVRQFYADEETARRVKSNVASYKVGVNDPVKVTPLYAGVAQSALEPTAEGKK